jgi:N-formylglutamate deformylase
MGTHIPPELASRMTPPALQTHDTDWHLDRLYGFARDLGASILMATHSRYVIDLNRPPDGTSLYPGQSVTGLCPVDAFDLAPIYLPGQEPDEAEVQRRVQTHWRPYHDQLATELARLKSEHGCATLWDAHSIRSVLPRFFEGRLPDLNLGTTNGASCAPGLADELLALAQTAPGCSAVLNGRFKGGHITRHYGRPHDGVHAVQLEKCWRTYMPETAPYAWHAEHAARVQPLLRQMVQTMRDWRPA